VKSAKPRARKGLYAPDVKSTKSEVRRAGITCKFAVSAERGRKVKRNLLRQRELVPVCAR